MNIFTVSVLTLLGFVAGMSTIDAGVPLWHAQLGSAISVTGISLLIDRS